MSIYNLGDMKANTAPNGKPTEALDAELRPSARWVYLRTVLVSTAIAVGLLIFAPRLGSFFELLVISQCIGLAIASLSMLAHRVVSIDRVPPPWNTVLCQLFALPLGYGLGLTIARALLGQPFRMPFQWNPTIGQGATLLATIVISMAMWAYAQREQSRRAQERAEHLLAQAELRMLRAQLEPHMLFNTLANLRALIEEDPKASLSMVDQFIAYLRGALGGSRVNERPLAEEFAQINAYLALMKLRFGARLDWHTSLPSHLNTALVPSFLLQPLVENAVRHGIEPRSSGGKVELEAQLKDGLLILTITNDGAGDLKSAVSSQSAQSSYGLEHVRQRLKTSYGDAAQFHLTSDQNQRTVATLTLPFQRDSASSTP